MVDRDERMVSENRYPATRRRIGEPIIELCIKLSGFLVVVFVFLIFLFLLKDSLSLFREYPTTFVWQPKKMLRCDKVAWKILPFSTS